MKVFVSYSADDSDFVRKVVDGIRNDVESVHWWDESKQLGQSCWDQIFSWIDEADLVLAIVTGKVLERGLAVGNEIGYAKAKGKEIIPLITDEDDRFDLGCLIGTVDQYIDENDPQSGIDAIKNHIKRNHPANDEVDWGQVLTVLGLVGVIWAATRK